MDIALVEHAEHDIDGEQCRSNQQGLMCERLLKRPGRPLESAVDRSRHAKPGHPVVDRRRRFAERYARREIERDRRGGEQIVVIDRNRPMACAKTAEGGERFYYFLRGAEVRAL